MKRIGLAVGVVLLAFLATVTVGNQSAGGTDKPPIVGWKAVPYGPITVNSFPSVSPLASLLFTVPEGGFVWLSSTGFCTFVSALNTITPGISIAWRSVGASPFPVSPGDALFNNILTTAFVGESLPYSASAVFPVSAGTGTFSLLLATPGPPGTPTSLGTVQCSGVNVVMFTNTQLP